MLCCTHGRTRKLISVCLTKHYRSLPGFNHTAAHPSRTLRSSLVKRVYVTAHASTNHELYNTRAGHLTLSDAQRRTIYALSTPPGKGGVAVIRVSGPAALEVWRRMTVRSTRKRRALLEPEPWRMERCHVVDPESGEVLDDGLAVFFKGPRSFTTEDVLELHIHSGRALVAAVLRALARLPQCRPAEPGEFTRRAFAGGRLDLTQVEGLRDLIDAETEGQRRLALRAAGGAAREQFEGLRKDIIHCLAMVEALIDFGEGEDIEEGVYEQARERAQQLRETILRHLGDSRRGEIMRSGIRLAIFGPPNVGKSSLLNFLAQREAAIVTSEAGTTRDILELSLDLGGLPILVADTAGLRETVNVVERIGVARARQAVDNADARLLVLSSPDALASHDRGACVVPEDVQALLTPDTFVLLNMVDTLNSPSVHRMTGEPGRSLQGLKNVAGVWTVSVRTGEGMHVFVKGLAQALQQKYDVIGDSSTETPLVTHARHRVHLESAVRFLEAFLDTPSDDVVLGAEELRYAAQAVGKVSGLIDVEDVLDAIFREFCIGK